MRRIPPATKVRHARAQHAAQSAEQPPDLCFLLQASSSKLRIQACSLGCLTRLCPSHPRRRARGHINRLGRRSKGAAAALSACSQHTASSQAVAGIAVNIIRVPHSSSPAACRLHDRASAQPASGSASDVRAPSFSCYVRSSSGAKVIAQHAACLSLLVLACSSLTIATARLPRMTSCWSGCGGTDGQYMRRVNSMRRGQR